MKRNRNMRGWIVFVAGLLAVSSGQASIFSGTGGDKLFSNTGNWDVYPTAGGTVTFAANSTSISAPAQVDSGFTGFTGANRLTSSTITAAAAQTTYLEILSGGNFEVVTLNIGWQTTQTARHGELTLKTGGRLQAGNGALSGTLTVGGTSNGKLTVEDGATFIATKIIVNAKGTLAYTFGADSVTTMSATATGADNTINGLLRLDLGALNNTAGSYTLIGSNGGALAGALKTWLDAGGGTQSGTGDVSTANFQIVNSAVDLKWALATDGQNLTLNVIPEPATLPLVVLSFAGLLAMRRLHV